MTITLFDNASRASSSSKNDTLEPKSDKNEPLDGIEFGQMMSNLMASQPLGANPSKGQAPGTDGNGLGIDGQSLAEADFGLKALESLPGGDLLKAIHLGPRMNVITPETAATDEQSLEAFARSQGLDETAVQWLMGTTAPSGMPGAPSQGVSASGSSMPSALTGLASVAGGSTGNGLGAAQVTPTQSLLATASATTTSSLPLTTTAASENPSNPGVSDLGSQPSGESIVAGKPGNAQPLSGVQIAINSAALWAMGQGAQGDKNTTNQTTEDSAMATAQVQLSMQGMPTTAAMWIQRNPLALAANKEAAVKKDVIFTSDLDLSEEITPELIEDWAALGSDGGAISAQDKQSSSFAPLPGQLNNRLESGPLARQETPNPNLAASAEGRGQRSENIQNLGEKMGQAVGQRILSEIEKGQWHLKLMLRPATLGHIEVEMRMRSGELDAVFTASQAITRELLQEGMSKLKDTLNQMGMDVASMQVGGGQTQQGGGEPTPDKSPKTANNTINDSKSPVPQAISLPRVKMGQDGWDVLV